MNNINIHNYESYLLDYFEGNLSEELTEQLMSFLKSNPKLLNEYGNSVLIPVFTYNYKETGFLYKNTLYKNSILSNQHSNIDELCIGRLEGDLSEKECIEFNKFKVENPEINSVYSLYEKTKNIPDFSIHYENKEKLKHKTSLYFLQKRKIYSYAVAASIVILFSILLLIPNNNQLNQNNETVGFILENKSKTQLDENIKTNTDNEKVNNNISINNSDIIKYTSTNKVKIENIANISMNTENEKIELISKLEPVNKGIPNKKPEGTFVQTNLLDLTESVSISSNNNSKSIKDLIIMNVNKKVFENNSNNNKINIWDIAQLGIKGINRITGSNMQLNKTVDAQGNLDKVEFDSKLIAFSSPVKK
ncbi:MAG: hypothetical protein A2041_09895 [Bacteroidetes bacterium GWA2_31_9b]|nr:MAG: hypothetical protein A2041_09895 [Bacteroidetes bacterium GWA2_31_9b]